jgi:hypothetical protein
MSFPSDVQLPIDSKYYCYRDTNRYNSNYDITWSMKYQLSGNISKQAGFAAFLSTTTTSPSVIPGQYLCTKSQHLSGDVTVTIKSSTTTLTAKPINIVSIAFDTTGYYALSSALRPGVSINSLSANSLIVRGYDDTIIFNSQLSSLGFSLDNSYQTIRYRYSNSNQALTIDYRSNTNVNYTNLATISIPYRIINESNADNIAAGITFCSPISTSATNQFINLVLNNFHIEGTSNNTKVKTIQPTIIT